MTRRILIALVGIAAACAVPAGLLRALRNRPATFPYVMVIFLKGASKAGLIAKKFGVAKQTSAEFFEIIGRVDVAGAKRIRDALIEVESVPTIANGLDELGYKSMIECYTARDYFKRTSPYTAPLQQPYVFLPGIPAKTFYDPSEFPFTKILEDNYEVIRDELDAVLADGGKGFKFYRGEFANEEKYWNNYHLFLLGNKVEENCARVPRTTEILESLPRFKNDLIMFSALNPKSHLPSHVGPINGVLRAHLPMIVPPGCRIKVGDEMREWEEGKVMVFDDSFWHEVWNDSDQLRIVLFLNFWHPSVPEEEVAPIERFRDVMEREFPGAEEYRKAQEEPRPHNLAGGPVPKAS